MEQQQPSKTLPTQAPPFQPQPPLCIEDQTKLLFFENFSQPKPQYTIEEIFFSKAVLLHQIRILKSDSNPHTKIKSMQSITQRTPIYKFEIFARNLKKVSDVFEKVFESEVINKENGELDTIFPFSKELITNHIVFRGSYEKITMCIYGIPFTGTDNHLLLETAKNEVALEKLSEIKSNQELNESDSFTPVKPEEMELIKKYPIDTLISPYIESANDCVIKRAYNINKPNVYMVDKTKTGYIYYENDIQSAAQLIMNLYLTYSKGKTRGNVPLPSDRDIIDHQKSFKILFEIMKILFSRNYTFLEDDCVFRNENLEILNKIPDIVIQIIINSLNGNFYGYTEIKYGLKLLKYISNSQNLVNKFIEYNGLDKLYTIIFQNEDEDSGGNSSGSGSSSNNSSNNNNSNSNNNGTYCSIIKALALECIYRCITFRSAFERFINGNCGSCGNNNNSNNNNTNSMQNTNTSNNNNNTSCTSSSDRKKFMSLYFSIKDIDMASISNLTDITSINGDTKSSNNNSSSTTKDQKESSKDKKKDKKDKDRDKDKKHKKKHHHSHSSKKDKSRSRSRSKSKDTKKSSSKKDSSSSKDKPRDRSSSNTKHKKSKKNQIPLKNGYQVIIALFLSNKKKVMISTLIKNIIIKVNLMLYMQSFNNSIQAILNNNTINVDFDKLIYQLTTIFQCITKLKISYKKCDLAENKGDSFLDNDYPFKQYWNDFIKTNRRFYKKFDDILYNTKSTLENDTHAYTKLLSAGVITNEIAYLLGAYSFLENLLLLICNEQVQMMNQFYDISIIIKHIFTYILLSKGGVNYLSKEIKLTETLYKVLCNVSQSIQDNDIVDESNFFMAQTESKEIYLNQSLYEPMKYARINELLIQTSQSNVDLLNDDMILKINFLQLKYLLEYSFTFMTHLDNLIIAREEGNDIMTANTSDYVNKSLNVLLNYNQNVNKSNLSLQAFLALAQNPFFLDEILTLLTTLTDDNISDFEGHIALIINLLHVAFCSLHITSDVLLLLYGRTFYDALTTVKQTLIAYYDMKEAEPINSNLYSDLDALISLLLPIKDCDNSGNVRSLMTSLNESLYNNLQKHNLNETLKIHEEKTREILNEYKLNVQKHDNNDINFLEKMMCKGSLMNEIFTIIKTINLSTKINSLLLLDCVSEHIHLALRYLIINGVNSFKYFINSNYAVIKYNAKNNEMNLLSLAVNPMQETNETMPKTECLVDKYDNIKEICTLLYHVFDILRTLLCNLLSSHVDTFRDSSIISKTESTIIECINFLYEIYVGNNNNNSSNSSVSSNINVSVVYYIQKVFESALKAYEQICKFNTTIKLNFPVLVEKIVATPKNKLGVVYLINFMLNVVNNEYTVESFVDCLTEETQHNQAIDLFSEIDNTKHPIHLSSLANDKSNILKYMIQSAITSNNDFLITQTGEIIQTIFKRYVAKNKLNIFNEITDEIKNQLKTAFNKVSNIKCGLLAEKDYEIYLQDFEAIIRILKFIMIFVKGDYKFLFIFHDIAFCYYKLLTYCRDYFNQIDLKANSNETNLLRDVIFDIMFLLLEGLDAICDSKRNNNKKFFYEKNIRYDLVEDLPSKEHIVTIIRELNNVLVFYCSVIDMNQSGANVTVNKMTLIVKKILDIYASLGLNFYGQNILLNQEYALKTYLPNNVLPQDTKPLISLAKLINVLVNAAENKIINNVILEITESLAQLIIILLYDLNYYENIACNNNNNNKEFQSSKMMVITKIRLHALANLFIDVGAGSSNTNSNVSNSINSNNTSPSSLHTNTTPIEKSISILISVLSKLKYLVDFFSENKSQTISFELCKSWEVLKKHQTNIDILDIDIKLGMLPNIRKIDVKFDLLNKFYTYYDIQPYGINFPYEITNADLHNLRSSHLTNSFTGGNFGENNMPMQPILGDKSQINEFSKLLNWKKHRIFLTKENSLNVRNRIFDLDTCVHSQGERKFFNEFDFYKLKKKHFYFNTDQFEQYCNGVFNSNLKIKTFANVSYAMTASTLNKIYLLSDESQSYNLKKYFLNHLSKSKANIGDVIRMEREHNGMNLLLNQNQTLLNRIKKKINSKLNLFIYKTKYEKYSSQIKPVSNPPPSSISKEQIRSMSKVSGRNLSTHVDNVVPGQKVVNLTYGGQPTNANVNGNNEDDNVNKDMNGSGNNNVNGNNNGLLNANNQQIQKTGSNVGTANTSMMINNNGGVSDVSGNTNNNNVNPNGMVIDSTIQQSQIKTQNDTANANVNVANPTTNINNPSQTQRPLLHPTNPVPLPQQIPFQQQPQDPNTSQQPGIPAQPMQPFNPMLKMQPYTLSGMPSFMMMNSMMRPSFPGMMPQPGIYPQFQQFQGIPMSMMGQMPQHPQAQAQQPQMPNQPQTQMMTAATAAQQAQMQTQPQMQTQLQDTVMSNANAQVNSTTQQTQSDGTVQQHQQGGQNKNGLNVLGNIMFTLEKPNQQGNEKSKDPRMRKKNK